ncbi:hypothetical protein K402DRAFT_398703 [Aulographum hederae CBS 113979]|uniref:DUF7719 domain-containing protein n=1 Tax=Aulographum hederae CBS 113979 TaxID=1176131 RepID=A0A6G1GJY9_9PEZI|nr:hypothetical protein K402DRAFT_398703 [Aulographum hederae CBS 113979]
MSSSPTPRNRKERRTASRGNQTSTSNQNDMDIPLRKPDYTSKPETKTLFQIAEERQELLRQGKPFPKSLSSSNSAPNSGDGPELDLISPLAEAILYTFTLTVLHLTLDALVNQQFKQKVDWGAIIPRTLLIAPLLFVLIYSLHTETALKVPLAREAVFFATAVVGGCYMIHVVNEEGYYAVMRRAPPVGTLWVWSVIEMHVGTAVGSLGVVGGWVWWMGLAMW